MMEMEEQIKKMIAEKLDVELSQVTDNASFTNDLSADSLDTVELLMDFEKTFDVKIPEEEAEKIATVGDVINFIKNAKK
ncbi:MAG: acyl carrier protein [Paludibacteraceae bacterium]|nr:acyl carrier protein [Paludibacteraceae bacterium]